MPKVSVIMPLYNAEKYVEKAIDSVLDQTFRDLELILVNDCPTDKTMELVRKIHDPRIRILENEGNRGISFSRNVGLENCNGQYIALMDDDDLTAPDRLEKEVGFLDKNAGIDAVGGRYCIIDENGAVLKMAAEPLVNPRFIRASFMFFNPIGNGSMMFRKKLVMENGIRFQEGCFGMEDYRFWIDCSLHGKITNLNDVFLYWRDSNDNESARSSSVFLHQRMEKFAQLQEYALKANGFVLDKKEIRLLQAMFPEGKLSGAASLGELKALLKVFRNMIDQAQRMQLENCEEIKILCRRQFSKRLEYSKVWM